VEAGAGVVDEDVDGAVMFEGAFDGPATGVLFGNITGDNECVGTAGTAKTLFVACDEREPGTGCSKLGGTGGADAFARASNENNFVLDSHERARKRHNGTMPKRLLPLFPLQLVVFPRTRLPLHIFEERYKEMVANAIRDESEFGIVLAKRDGIVNAGCTVRVEKVLEMYPDGRMDILTRGERRFEIDGINQEKDYLRAEVSFFDDEDVDAAPEEEREKAIEQYRALNELGTARDHSEPDLK